MHFVWRWWWFGCLLWDIACCVRVLTFYYFALAAWYFCMVVRLDMWRTLCMPAAAFTMNVRVWFGRAGTILLLLSALCLCASPSLCCSILITTPKLLAALCLDPHHYRYLVLRFPCAFLPACHLPAYLTALYARFPLPLLPYFVLPLLRRGTVYISCFLPRF